jgi:AcrR family transcriptional regulator
MNNSRRQQKKEQTRKLLLEVAFVEFSQRGIMATRMSDIAQAAGVSHGTVFLHFETQETLITAVIEEFGKKIARRTHELAAGSGGLKDGLKAHLEAIGEFEDFYSRVIQEHAFLPAAARETYVMIQSAISFHLSQLAQREMEAGLIKAMPFHLLFNTWVGLVNYYIMNKDLFAPQDSVLKRYGDVLLDHYMNLIELKE